MLSERIDALLIVIDEIEQDERAKSHNLFSGTIPCHVVRKILSGEWTAQNYRDWHNAIREKVTKYMDEHWPKKSVP